MKPIDVFKRLYDLTKENYRHMNDRELWEAHGQQSDDVTAFIYMTNYGLWCNISLSYKPFMADDEIQRCIMNTIAKGMISYNGEYALMTWLGKIFLNELLMVRRKQTSSKGVTERNTASLEFTISESNAFDGDTELASIIGYIPNEFENIWIEHLHETIMNTFSAQQQNIIHLYEEGLLQDEIAALTGYSQSYVSRVKVWYKKRLCKITM